MSDDPIYGPNYCHLIQMDCSALVEATAKLKEAGEELAEWREHNPTPAGLLAERKRAWDAEEDCKALQAEVARLRQDRLDYSSVTTTEGLNASEWVWRTGKAERESKEIRRAADGIKRTATEAALRYAWSGTVHGSQVETYVTRGLKALLE